MTLGEIKTNVLKGMGVYSENLGDENPGQQYEPMLTTYINDGYALVCNKYKPVTTKSVVAEPMGRIPLSHFLGLIGVVGVFYYDTDGNSASMSYQISRCGMFLHVCAPDGVGGITVAYTHMPEPMREDTDVPIFEPIILHPMLAEYALYRMMGMYTVGDSQAARLHFAMFQEMLAKLRPQQSAGGRDMYNMYARW